MRFDTAVVGAVAAASGVSAQLHELAVRAGLKYWGTTMDNGYRSDAPYMAILNDKREHGQLVPENGQKWAYVQPSRGQFTYTNADVVPNIAIANGQVLRCHAFVWHSQLPNWVANGNWSPDELREIITSHINNVGTHYKGKCYAWDVVNEAAADDGGWRDSVFYRVLGTSFLPFSFNAAKAVDPDTKLYYNDYNLEYNGAKTDRAVEIVNIIQAAGAPIDGVGFQGHLIVGSTPGRSALATALRRFTALGVEVAYTELDIRHSSVPASATANQRQASDYANVVGSCLDVDGCIGVTVWGFTDKYSWIPNTFSGAGEALIYDKDFNKKPAWTAVSSVLAAAATGQPPVSSSTSRAPPSSTAPPSTTLISSTRTSSSPPQSSTSAPPTGTVPRWGQCGGRNWTGPTQCQAPWTCKVSNEWYSQCL